MTNHARPIAVTAGIVFSAGQLAVYLATRGDDPLLDVATTTYYRAGCVLLLAGFIALVFAAFALHARQEGRGGAAGSIGLIGAVTGTVLMAGDWWFETFGVAYYAGTMPQIFDAPAGGWLAAGGLTSYVTFALGWAVFGFSCLRAELVSKVVGFALIAGGLLGYGAVAPPSGLGIGVAVAWAGFALRDRAATPAMDAEEAR